VATGDAELGRAPDALAAILDRAPPVIDESFRGKTRLTGRWGHGALHDYLGGMEGHVLITYYDSPQDIVWRRGSERLSGVTRSGTLTLIPEGQEGRWDISGPINVSHVFLPHERLVAGAELLIGTKPIELLPRVGFEDPVAARLMELLGREASSADASSRLFVEQATDLLVTQLVRGHSSFGAIELRNNRGGLADWQVKKVTQYMREHLDEPIGLDELATIVGLSRFHFCTAFRQATGKTPHQYLVRERIERARQLLSYAEIPITEVALAVGYETPSSFAASFRKVTGMTPSTYRQTG
jgi:AraC family transcriptional regulator